ncbi:MAG: DUF6714 family protein [Planctomycetaceae bacterium]
MDERRRQLLAHIERAFAGVTLGDGVSLHESDVMDNWGTAEERRAAREPDEKLDWRRLVDHPDLAVIFGLACGGLCHLDAAGVRFHLPACLSRAVRDLDRDHDRIAEMFESVSDLLTELRPHNRVRLEVLNGEQRACVRECLVFFRESLPDNDPVWAKAIDGYWSRPAS